MVEFTDVQLVDPFKLRKDVHQFVELEDGVLVKDRIHYELPFGVIGQFAHSLFIKKRIEEIFSYRRKL